MGYKLLGWAVWNFGGRYLRRRYGNRQPSDKAKLILLVGGLVIAAVVALYGLNGGRTSDALDIEE